MAKIARTPFNGARIITASISSDKAIIQKETGYTYFVNAQEAVAINLAYTSGGSYHKLILKEDSAGDITLTFSAVVGLLISDDSGVSVVEGTGTTITIPSGAKAGTYIDLICDGSKWYANGMSASAAFTIS